MFGISAEHLLILGIVLLIFGPRKLPELGNTLGKAIRNFKDSVNGVEDAKFRKLPEDAPAQQPEFLAQQKSIVTPQPLTTPSAAQTQQTSSTVQGSAT